MYTTVGRGLTLSDANDLQAKHENSRIVHNGILFDVTVNVNVVEFKKYQEQWIDRQCEIIDGLLARMGLEVIEGDKCWWDKRLHEIVNMQPPNNVDDCKRFAGLTEGTGLQPLYTKPGILRPIVNRYMKAKDASVENV